MKNTRSALLYLVCIASPGALLPAHAQAGVAPPMLVERADGMGVTAEDVLADATRIPAEHRKRIFANPRDVSLLARNLFLQRALAQEAEKSGLDKDPMVARALLLAREKTLAEAMVRQADGTPPDDAAIEKLALTEYNAFPERYMTEEEVRARHILIKAEREDGRKVAEELLEKLKSGQAEFPALAAQYSEDPGSRRIGGDLGFFSRGKMAKPFEEAAFALANPGDLSGIVQTQFGYHIIKLEGRKAPARKSFEEAKEGIKRDILARLLKERRNELVMPIEASAKFNAEALEAFAAPYRAELPSQEEAARQRKAMKPPKR